MSPSYGTDGMKVGGKLSGRTKETTRGEGEGYVGGGGDGGGIRSESIHHRLTQKGVM